MIPAAVLVIIDLIIVSSFTLYNIFKNREQDNRLDAQGNAIDALGAEVNRLRDRPIVTPPLKPNVRV